MFKMSMISLFFAVSIPSYASVIITNTRVIYDPAQKSKVVELSNNDDVPYLIQAWTDKGDKNSTPSTSGGDFIVSPPIFKIEPHTGQLIKLVYTGAGLPLNKESLFYLNTLQIPPKNLTQEKNAVAVLLRNRLKIFYRPSTIEGKASDAYKKLSFSLDSSDKNRKIIISNPTGFYVNFSSIYVTHANKKIKIDAETIPPMSNNAYAMDGMADVGDNVNFISINDLGGNINYNVKIVR